MRLFRADQDDVVYYQVADVNGVTVSGDAEIPPMPTSSALDGEDVQLRDAMIHGEEVRIAWRFVRPDPAQADRFVLVQVAETRNKRTDLASRVVTGVLLPQFAIIPLAVVLVWVGLSRGIAPLNRLQSLIRRRRPTDLSPVEPSSVPEEVRPLIIAYNDMMARLEENLQAQQRFIADAAHQMRTPLTGLKMQTDLAMHETDPDQLRQSLTRIAESTDRAAHLINQLLSLARAEASFEKLYAVETVDLDAIVREVALELYPRAQAKQIDLGVEAGDQGPARGGQPGAAARDAQEPGRQRDQVHPAWRQRHRAHALRRLAGVRGRGQRARASPRPTASVSSSASTACSAAASMDPASGCRSCARSPSCTAAPSPWTPAPAGAARWRAWCSRAATCSRRRACRAITTRSAEDVRSPCGQHCSRDPLTRENRLAIMRTSLAS